MSEAEPQELFEWSLASPTDGDLRQGDIVGDFVFPIWNLNNSTSSTSDLGGGVISKQVSVVNKGAESPIVICSHDCDLDNTQSKSRMGVIVAPVLPWPFAESDERSQILWQSRVPREVRDDADQLSMVWDFINLWPISLGENRFENWRVADLSALSSMSPANKVAANLRKRERIEMSETGRQRFAAKLAAMFYREQ